MLIACTLFFRVTFLLYEFYLLDYILKKNTKSATIKIWSAINIYYGHIYIYVCFCMYLMLTMVKYSKPYKLISSVSYTSYLWLKKKLKKGVTPNIPVLEKDGQVWWQLHNFLSFSFFLLKNMSFILATLLPQMLVTLNLE